MRLLEVFSSVLAGLAAVSCGGAGLNSHESIEGHVVDPGRDGFYRLDARWSAGDPQILVAQTPSELDELWSNLRLAAHPPPVDFSAYLVIGLKQASDCLDAYVQRLLVKLSRRVYLEIQWGDDDDSLGECHGTNQGYVLAFAVARRALPPQFEFFAPEQPSVTIAQHWSPPTPGRDWLLTDPSPKPTVVRARVPRPTPREPRFARLGDGTPVWAVAHTDGTFSVLRAMQAEVLAGYLVGLWVIPQYDPQSGLFSFEWDEYGVNAWSMRPNLLRYAVDIDSHDSTQLVVGESIPASRRSTALAARGPYKRRAAPQLSDTPCSLEQGRATQEGQMVVIDGQVFFDGNRACLQEKAAKTQNGACSPDSLPIPDVRAVNAPGLRCWLDGPVLARARRGGFSEVVRLGPPGHCTLVGTSTRSPEN